MLTHRHLALIRAALQFFDEEIVPHGRKTIRMYLDAPLGRTPTSAEIQELRSDLKKVTVKYGRYQARRRQLSDTGLSHSIAQTELSADEVIAIVLVPHTR